MALNFKKTGLTAPFGRDILIKVLALGRLFFIFCCFPGFSRAAESSLSSTETPMPTVESEDSLPLWDAGAALIYLRFPFYPASDQTKTWFLPAPTFEYRGEILRSTQREGTRAYFLRSDRWSLEMGGDGVPEVKSNETFARQGMDNIPWSLQLGPKAVYRGDDNLVISLGVNQVIATDFTRFKANGLTYEARIGKTWLKEVSPWSHHGIYKTVLSIGGSSATADYLATYFEVSPEFATASRPAYEARAGFLSYDILIGQSVKFKNFSLFSYVNSERFENSVNRRSPLHKSDDNLLVTFGFSYVLFQSDKKSIPESESEGLLQKINPFTAPNSDSK